MTTNTNNDITYEDYETIRTWVDAEDASKYDAIVSLLIKNPLPELKSKYDDFEEKVVKLIKEYGDECRLVTFTESINYEDEVRLYVPADQTEEQIQDEWISGRYVDDVVAEQQSFMELEHDNVEIDKECVVRLRVRVRDSFLIRKDDA